MTFFPRTSKKRLSKELKATIRLVNEFWERWIVVPCSKNHGSCCKSPTDSGEETDGTWSIRTNKTHPLEKLHINKCTYLCLHGSTKKKILYLSTLQLIIDYNIIHFTSTLYLQSEKVLFCSYLLPAFLKLTSSMLQEEIKTFWKRIRQRWYDKHEPRSTCIFNA